jgi:hypothetical protein
MTPGVAYVRRQVAGRFYAEALYFGALELAGGAAPSAELHLCLGLAACGAIGGCADVQRMLHGASDGDGAGGDSATGGPPARPMAGSRSMLVYEGFFHLLEAARAGLHVPDELGAVGAAVLDDLGWYLRDDFKGVALSGRRYTARDVVCGAASLLRRLLRTAPALRDDLAGWLERGDELVGAELAREGGDAAFYGAHATARPG